MENETTKTKLSTPAAIIIAGFLIMVGIIISKAPVQKKVVADDSQAKVKNEIAIEPVSETEDHILGNINTAEVTIVEFSDTECPYCKVFHQTLHKTMAKYPGKIAWVYRHFPLDSIHPKTRMEARATECVASIGGNDAFWKYLDMIFDKTPSNNKLDEKQLPIFAEKIGINQKAFSDCFAKDIFDGKIEAQYEDGQKAGVLGTPHSIIITKDGQKIPIQGADEQSLDSELSKLLQ